MVMVKEKAPVVGKPGGGLPFYEWFIAKYFLLPRAYRDTTLADARKFFELETEKIIKLSKTIDAESAKKRVLIPRLRGLEDNSRYWSFAMAVDHLRIVGTGLTGVILDLTMGGSKRKAVLIEDVKPDPGVELTTAIDGFKKMTDQFLGDIAISEIDNYPEVRFEHPWFGPMNARQWYVLSGWHQAIHRQQMKEIIKGLNGR